VDASSWPRCDAETSPQRGFYYHPSRHPNGQPIVAGWSYQWVTQLSFSADSWTASLDARRIPPTADTTAAQVRDLVTRLAGPDDNTQHDHTQHINTDPAVPMFVLDAGYDPIALTHALADVHATLVVRVRDDRVFYPDPAPPAPGQLRRPRRHGARFGYADPTSWPDPDDELTATDSRYGTVRVTAWHGLHPEFGRRGRWAHHEVAPIVRGTVIRVEVEHLLKPTASEENAVAVGHRSRTGRPAHLLAGLPAPFRHRTHLPVREEHAGLDHPSAAHPRTGRPLDLAHRHQLHPAAPGPHARRRPPPALGTAPRPRQAHPGPRPPRVSPTSHDHRHPSQSTEIHQTRTLKATRHPHRPPNPLPSDQESRLTASHGFNRKLSQTEQIHAGHLRAFTLVVERALFDAQRARRQYDAVEPENRLVVRTLERTLEAKLTAQRHAEQELLAQQARRPVKLTDDELAWLHRAGADVRTVFDAPTTSFPPP
jgi:hypothetical protein